MPGRVIMTVTGPIDPADLGPTDAHDHLFLQTPAQPDDTMDDFERAVTELEQGRATGLAAFVDLTPIGLGRQPELLREAAFRTGVTIVAASGYHRDAHYSAGDWVNNASEDELTTRVISDINYGMDRTTIRSGVIKGGASLNRPSAMEALRLRAIAAAAQATGAAIFVHTEAGTGGPAIVDLLAAEGTPADRITLAHMDRNPDRALHVELLRGGINFVYDTIGREKYGQDSARIDLIADMLDAGFGDRLMLGLDLGRRAYHRAYGGEPGLGHLLASFAPALRQRVGDGPVEQMLITNPARVLAMPA